MKKAPVEPCVVKCVSTLRNLTALTSSRQWKHVQLHLYSDLKLLRLKQVNAFCLVV